MRDIEEMGVREMRSHSSDSRFYTGTGSPEQLNATLTRDDSVMSKDEDSRVYGEGEEERMGCKPRKHSAQWSGGGGGKW